MSYRLAVISYPHESAHIHNHTGPSPPAHSTICIAIAIAITIAIDIVVNTISHLTSRLTPQSPRS